MEDKVQADAIVHGTVCLLWHSLGARVFAIQQPCSLKLANGTTLEWASVLSSWVLPFPGFYDQFHSFPKGLLQNPSRSTGMFPLTSVGFVLGTA